MHKYAFNIQPLIRKKWLFAVLCGYNHKNQLGLELKIILPIEYSEEPKK